MSEATREREALLQALLEADAEPLRGGSPEEAPEPPEEPTEEPPEEPPTEEVLLDYLRGRLPPEAEASLQARLLYDPETTRRLLDLDELVQATREEADSAEVGDLATAAGWREFRSRITEPSPSARASSGDPAGSFAASPLWLRAAAAMLLVSTLALSLHLRRVQRRPLPPEINFASLELGTHRGPSAGVQEVEIRPRERFRLVLSPETSCAGYRAEIARRGKPTEPLYVLEGLERDLYDRLDVFLTLPPGDYLFRLSGCDPPRDLEQYPIRVTQREGP